MDYTHIDSSNNKWVWSGTTSDGRSWYENDDVSDQVKYLYYSTRAGGWLLTATAPDLSAADPWVGGNNQVLFRGQAHGDSPTGSSTTQISTAATIPAIPPMVARRPRAATVVTTTGAIMTAR